MSERENPRWTACRAAMGREPRAWEFIIWINARWIEYARHLGVPTSGSAAQSVYRSIGYDEGQRAFDLWLSPRSGQLELFDEVTP